MIIKNAFNYTGSKDRIMQQLLHNIDYSKKTFIDFFCGSGTVGVNVASRGFSRIVLNDGCWQVAEVLKAIYEDEHFIEKVDAVINQYKLGKNNKEEFLALRELYNTEYCHEDTFIPTVLYALTMHAFNYFMIFNRGEGFSVPSGFGRSSFNSSIRKKLEVFQNEMRNYDIEVYSFKMNQFIDLIKDSYTDEELKALAFYFDPPYSKCCSDSSVNRSYGLTWGESDDKILLNFCDWLTEKGASFTLSNVLENNGKENKLMKKWSEKYTVVPVELDYTNCHFQRKNDGETKEVIIRNF